MSSYRKQLGFYLSVLLPQTTLAHFLSIDNLSLSQFQPETNKFGILQHHFRNHWDGLPLAIHQFQQLSLKHQFAIAPKINTLTSMWKEEDLNKLPDDIFAFILNEDLKRMDKIPSKQDKTYPIWENAVALFEKLDPTAQPILHPEFLRLHKTIQPPVVLNKNS